MTIRILAGAAVLIMLPACSSEAAMGHNDPVIPVVLALAIILAVAKIGGDLATRIGQPSVLGELLAGVILGSLDLVGVIWFDAIKSNATVDILARLGVIILLFEVGLESTVRDMMKVGLPSLFVALLGIVAPSLRPTVDGSCLLVRCSGSWVSRFFFYSARWSWGSNSHRGSSVLHRGSAVAAYSWLQR